MPKTRPGQPLRGVLLVLTVTLMTLGLPALSDASKIEKGDPNDSPGPWDIAEISVRHGSGYLVHSIKLHDRLKWESSLDPRKDRYLTLAFNTDSDGPAERFAFVFWGGSEGMVAVVTNARGRVIDTAGVTMPGNRTVSVWVKPAQLGRPAGYRWIAVSRWKMAYTKCKPTCVDIAPNRKALLHDLTDPRIDPETDPFAYTLTFPIDFVVQDFGFSGVRGWMIESRSMGESDWTIAASGSGGGAKSVPFAAESDGTSYEFRITAFDRQGNKCVTDPFPVLVPRDDASLPLDAYQGTWSQGGGSEDFLGTLHTSSQADDSVTFQFSGGRLWIVAPGGDGQFQVLIDGISRGTVDLSNYQGQHKARVFEWADFTNPGSHTGELKVLAGTVALDGLVAPPNSLVGPPESDPCEIRS